METENLTVLNKETQLDEVIKNSGLEIQEGEEIKKSYQPFLIQLSEIQEQAKKINFDKPTEIDETIARELRLKTVKIRTGSAELKDNRKKIHLLKGNLEQASYNLICASCKLAEETFVVVEKAREIAEKKRKAELKEARLLLINDFCKNAEIYPLSEMSEDAFNELLNGLKLAKKQKEDAERKAEDERIAKEKAEKLYYERLNLIAPYSQFNKKIELTINTSVEDFNILLKDLTEQKIKYEKEQEQIRVENAKLKAEAEEKERLAKIEQAKRDKIEQERLDKERKEKEQREKEEAKKKAETEAILQAEKDKQLKLENELKKRKLAEEEAEKKKKLELEAELNKGDKEKVEDLKNDLKLLKTKYSFKSEKNKKMYSDVSGLIDKVINFIN